MSNGSVRNIDEHLDGVRPNKQSKKLKADFGTTNSGLFENLRSVALDRYKSESYEGKTEFYATVLRVKNATGPNPEAPSISVRARIPELHSHLPMPKSASDNKVIDMYPEFIAEKSTGFAGLVAGSIVRVTHADRHQTSLRYNNGRLLELVGKAGNVAGFATQDSRNLKAASKRERLDTQVSFSCPPRKPLTRSPKGSVLPDSNNLNKKISSRNPRTINRSSDLSTFPESAYSSGGCADQDPNNPSSSEVAPNGAPSQGPQGVNSANPQNYGGTLESAGVGRPGGLDCTRTYTVQQTVLELPTPAVSKFDFSVKDVPKTWSAANDRKIQALHPKIRPLAAYFINTAFEQGFKLRITSAFRSIADQERIRRPRLLNPNGPITGPLKPGVPAVAKPGRSPHNFGLALDVAEVPTEANGFKAGQMSCKNGYPRERWHQLGDIGKECGFTSWGGDYSKWDPVHFHLTFGKSIRQLKKLYDKGEVFKNNGNTYVKI